MRITKDSRRTVRDVIEQTAGVHGERTFLLVDDSEVSFGQLDRRANVLANGLHAWGVERQENVLVMLDDNVDFIATWLALSKIAAVEVPINRAYHGDLLIQLVNDSQARRAIIAAEYLPLFTEVYDQLQHLEQVICYPEGPEQDAPLTSDFRLQPFSVLEDHPDTPPVVDGPAHNELAAILYTSGTTGASKGVMIYHAHAYEYANCTAQALELGAADVYFAPLPLFHIAGQWAVVYAALIADARVVLKQRFSVSSYWETIRRYRANTTLLIDVMANYLLNQPESPDDVSTSLDKVHMSAVIPELDRFRQRFGVRVTTDVASTEMCVPLRAGYQGEPHRFYDLDDYRVCGREVSDRFQVRLVDEHDQEVAVGEIGELVVRSRDPWTLMGGYWNKPEATLRAWRNLWFHTGDGLYRDERGNYYFVDRLRDVIRRRGENISSTEVENAINLHPAVDECAVVGVATANGDEELLAVVVRDKAASLTEEELIEFLMSRLPAFMVPRYLDFSRDVPKTQTGKIQKYPLREQGLTPNTWDRTAGTAFAGEQS